MSIKLANNQSLSEVTAVPSSITGGSWTLISTETASSDSTIDFTSGIDDTYKKYILKFINIHPVDDNADCQINFRDGGSAFDATTSSTYFHASHDEADTATDVSYQTGMDLVQGTGFFPIAKSIGNANDEGFSGELHLFDPSNTTFVKHFIATVNSLNGSGVLYNSFIAGYSNHSAAIDGIQVKMESGNIDSGVIKLYGVS